MVVIYIVSISVIIADLLGFLNLLWISLPDTWKLRKDVIFACPGGGLPDLLWRAKLSHPVSPFHADTGF